MSAQYGGQRYVTDELRQEPVDLDQLLAEECIRNAEREGYQPIGEPRVRWHQLTEYDVVLRKDLNPHGSYQAGDWDAFVVVDVAEAKP